MVLNRIACESSAIFFSVNSKTTYMKDYLKLVLVVILFIPCLAMLNCENPISNEWNAWVNIAGIIYSYGYYKIVLMKTFKNL